MLMEQQTWLYVRCTSTFTGSLRSRFKVIKHHFKCSAYAVIINSTCLYFDNGLLLGLATKARSQLQVTTINAAHRSKGHQSHLANALQPPFTARSAESFIQSADNNPVVSVEVLKPISPQKGMLHTNPSLLV